MGVHMWVSTQGAETVGSLHLRSDPGSAVAGAVDEAVARGCGQDMAYGGWGSPGRPQSCTRSLRAGWPVGSVGRVSNSTSGGDFTVHEFEPRV